MTLLSSFKKALQKISSQDKDADKVEKVINNDSETIPEVIKAVPKKSVNDDPKFADIFICRTCGKKFNSEIELSNHHKSQSAIWEPYLEPIPNNNSSTKNYVCENCGKKFNNEFDFLNHFHVIKPIPPIQNYTQIAHPENEEGFVCKTCARVFSTEYELLNHIHRPGDILAIKDPDSKPVVSHKIDKPIDTRFISEKEVDVSSPKSELLRYNKFKGKIGYIPKK